MKPALLNIFEMPKYHDCLLNKNTLFPLTVKNLTMLANSNSLEIFNQFTDKFYTKFNLF